MSLLPAISSSQHKITTGLRPCCPAVVSGGAIRPCPPVSRRVSDGGAARTFCSLRRCCCAWGPDRSVSMRNVSMQTLLLAGLLLSAISGAIAHDSWISRGLFRNTAGEWCCGDGDCFIVPPDQVSTIGKGYRLFGSEMVPFAETQPSPD